MCSKPCVIEISTIPLNSSDIPRTLEISILSLYIRKFWHSLHAGHIGPGFTGNMGPEQQIANLSEELLKDGSCFDEAVQAADLLATQLAVQSEFNKTAAILRNSPADATLPNRERLSVFLKFLCEETPQNPKRDRLRTLHIDAKIFCAECYPVSRLMTLPKAQFDFIIKKVSIYIKLHGLAPYLYRQDLNTRFTNFEHSVGASGYNEYLEGLAKGT